MRTRPSSIPLCRSEAMWACLLFPLLFVSSFSSRHKGRPTISGSGNTDLDPSKASECRFGGQSYELEDKWHPDLGAPFGVMYCVHCECVPIHKKRRIVGRVLCKNIKAECPKPTCPEPVLLPGRCCKICPGQTDNPDLAITVDLEREEQEKNGRHYASVLTGTGVQGAAAARLYFRKKTLQWSFISSQTLSPPLHVTFLDIQENILEEFSPVVSELYNRTGKLCGAWTRLPRKYRKILRGEQMKVSLAFPEGILSGTVNKYYGLTSELFSGLLEGPAGVGTAIISLNVDTGGLHCNILFKGIVKEGETNVMLTVRLTSTKGDETRIVEESVILEASGEELSSVEIRTILETVQLDALGRGEMILTIFPTDIPQRKLVGQLIPRISCDIMDCILIPTSPDSNVRGMAFMYFDRHGSLQYNIRVESSRELSRISFDTGKRSNRQLTNIDGLDAAFSDGAESGSIRLTSLEVDDLLKENLYMDLVTRSSEGEDASLRGRILTHLATNTDMTGQAILLTGNNSGIEGLVWSSMDDSCRLYYSLRIEVQDLDMENVDSLLELEDYPLENLKALPLFPSNKRKLQVCKGKRCTGHVDDLHKLTVARLDSGDAALVLTVGDIRVKGDLGHVETPPTCLPSYARNSLEVIPGYLSDLGEEVPADIKQKCYYEGAFFSEGEQWEASHSECQMCSCQRGKVLCDAMVCPPTNCVNPIIPHGECCAMCGVPNNGTVRGCQLGEDPTFHMEGSKWHPYIPPFGFSRCAVCTCEETTLTIHCFKETCPQLDCPNSETVRPSPLSCCKSCRQHELVATDERDLVQLEPDKQADMAQERTGIDILASGGCKWKGKYHENGDTWHPVVLPWGEMRCITCSCKEGEAGCKKKRCPQLLCALQVHDESRCCPRCATNKKEELEARQKLSLNYRRQQRRLRRVQGRREI